MTRHATTAQGGVASAGFDPAVGADATPGLDPGSVTPPPKRYKIGELSAFSGLSRQTLHNYTRWGLIHAIGWTEGGHRLYDESVFARLARVLQWRPYLTVPEMRRRLDGGAGSNLVESNAEDGQRHG
jgi:hypothetical protein